MFVWISRVQLDYVITRHQSCYVRRSRLSNRAIFTHTTLETWSPVNLTRRFSYHPDFVALSRLVLDGGQPLLLAQSPLHTVYTMPAHTYVTTTHVNSSSLIDTSINSWELTIPQPKMRPANHQPVSISPITPSLLLGNLASSYSIPTLMHYSITAIVSLGIKPCPEWSRPANRKLVPETNHLFITCNDSPSEDLLCHLSDICDFIDEQTAEPDLHTILERAEEDSLWLARGGWGHHRLPARTTATSLEPGRVLVHCTMGVSRSPAVVIAYLMRKERRSLEEVLGEVGSKRPCVGPWNFMEQLRIWQEVGYEVWEGGERKVPKEPYRRWLERLKGPGQRRSSC